MNSAVNQLLMFALVIGIMLVGMDFITKAAGFQAMYRRILNRTWRYIRGHVSRFLRFAWREYKQFIVGTAAGIIATLYCTGHFS